MLINELDAENTDMLIMFPFQEMQRFHQAVRKEPCIGVEEEDIFRVCQFRPLVTSVGETFILMVPDYREREVQAIQAVRRTIRRRIVHHDTLAQAENGRWACKQNGLQTIPQLKPSVPVNNDNIQVNHYGLFVGWHSLFDLADLVTQQVWLQEPMFHLTQ